jgi:hypothetical protein
VTSTVLITSTVANNIDYRPEKTSNSLNFPPFNSLCPSIFVDRTTTHVW